MNEEAGQLAARASAVYLRRNAVPTPEQVEQRVLAQAEIERVLGVLDVSAEVIASPLGTGWTDVFHVGAASPSGESLIAQGWLEITGLAARCGLGGSARWAVIASGRVLAALCFCEAAHDPVASIIERCRAQGSVTVRDVLELRELAQTGTPLPAVSDVLTLAADIEISFDTRVLVKWTSGRRLDAPAPLPAKRHRPRVVVAVGGVDGAGKSSVLEGVRTDLVAVGIPTSRVWLRPGMGLGPLVDLASKVKRLRRMDQRPGVAVVASGPTSELASRRGVMGWVWSSAVTASFVRGLRHQHRESSGVVLYDRHLADALATLDVVYAGSNLTLQRSAVRRGVPHAEVSVFLDVPVEVAVARKPDDLLGTSAVERQIEAYESCLPAIAGLHRLDGTQPIAESVRQTFELVAQVEAQ
jgi:thymidylate kinase